MAGRPKTKDRTSGVQDGESLGFLVHLPPCRAIELGEGIELDHTALVAPRPGNGAVDEEGVPE